MPHLTKTWLSFLLIVSCCRSEEHDLQISVKDVHGYLTFLKAVYDKSTISVYLPTSQQCCGGHVYLKRSRLKCCGKGEYDVRTQVCCQDVVYTRRVGFDCCGKKYYSKDTGHCCPSIGTDNVASDGRTFVVVFPKNVMHLPFLKEQFQCCGKRRLYNPQYELCCPVAVGDVKANGNNFLQATTIYNVVKKQNNETVCLNTKSLDPWNKRRRRHTYSKYQIVITDSSLQRCGMRHCGKKVFNYMTHLCCGIDGDRSNDLVVVKRNNAADQCCGADVYNPVYEMCCGGRVYQTRDNGHLLCCGIAVYDPEVQWCCDSSTSTVMAANYGNGNDACCGPRAALYNASSHICCGGKVVNILSSATSRMGCCVSEVAGHSSGLYDMDAQLCCDGEILKKPPNSGKSYKRAVCCGKNVVWPKLQICCGGKIHYLKDSHTSRCCGEITYDYETQVCCGTQVINKKFPKDSGCCGSLPYNPYDEICCVDLTTADSHIERRKSMTQSCCGKTPYEPSENWCCGENVIPREDLCCIGQDEENRYIFNSFCPATPTAECCGLEVYDPVVELCCNGTVVRVHDQNLKCCGSAAYNTKKQLCCNGRIRDVGGNPDLECCGDQLMNVNRAICCGGFIKRTGNPEIAQCCFPQ